MTNINYISLIVANRWNSETATLLQCVI